MTLTHWITREYMNAAALAMFLCLTVRFARIWYCSPSESPRHDGAIALSVLCAGESLRSAWAWLALAAQNKGWAIFPVVQQSFLLGVIAITGILIGGFCCLRVFRPPGSTRGMLVAMMMVIVFLAVTHFL